MAERPDPTGFCGVLRGSEENFLNILSIIYYIHYIHIISIVYKFLIKKT